MREDEPNMPDRHQDRYSQRIAFIPFGSTMMEVESLSGYLQRVAKSVYLPVTSLITSMLGPDQKGYWRHSSHFYENLRQVDCLPPEFEHLSHWTQQPPSVLERLTFLPLFRAFNGRDLLTKNHLARFFFPTKEECLISSVRRWCPLCLHEKFYYRLSWQLREILICPTHQMYLVDRCSHCGKASSVLSSGSYFGHCDHCRFPIPHSVKPQRATGAALLHRQHQIIDDYLHIWSQRIAPDEMEGKNIRQGVKERLRTLRTGRYLSMEEEKRLTGRKMTTLYDHRDWMITLASMRRLLGFYNISVADFSKIRAKPVQRDNAFPDMKCANPWCSAYETLARPLRYKKCCRSCGARIVRDSEKILGIPTRQLLQGVYKLYTEGLGDQQTAFLERFRAAGLPARNMSRLMDRLKRWGLANGSSKTGWSLCHVTRFQNRHFPVTPAIALLSRKLDRSHLIQREQQIYSAIDRVFRQGRPVNVAEIAKELKKTGYVLHGWLWQLSRSRRTAIVNHMKTLRQQQKRERLQQAVHQVAEVLEALAKDGTPITKIRVFSILRLPQDFTRIPDPRVHIEIHRCIEAAIRKQLDDRRQRLKAEMVKAAEQLWSTGMVLSRNKMRSRIGSCFGHDQELDREVASV